MSRWEHGPGKSCVTRRCTYRYDWRPCERIFTMSQTLVNQHIPEAFTYSASILGCHQQALSSLVMWSESLSGSWASEHTLAHLAEHVRYVCHLDCFVIVWHHERVKKHSELLCEKLKYQNHKTTKLRVKFPLLWRMEATTGCTSAAQVAAGSCKWKRAQTLPT